MDRKSLTEQQRQIVTRLEAVFSLGRTWMNAAEKARAKVADPTQRISTWGIEDLAEAVSTEPMVREIQQLQDHLGAFNTVEWEKLDHGDARISAVNSFSNAQEALSLFTRSVESRVLGWYMPNSTSNISVEVQLRQHANDVVLYKACTGRRF